MTEQEYADTTDLIHLRIVQAHLANLHDPRGFASARAAIAERLAELEDVVKTEEPTRG